MHPSFHLPICTSSIRALGPRTKEKQAASRLSERRVPSGCQQGDPVQGRPRGPSSCRRGPGLEGRTPCLLSGPSRKSWSLGLKLEE